MQVRAARLTPDDILLALRRGAFYATSGVELRSVEHSESDLRVSIEARAGTAYHTRFIGTRRGSDAVGATLFETDDNPAVYTFTGDELYVRAVVTSSELHPNPYAAGDLETAWVQPVRPGDAGSGQN